MIILLLLAKNFQVKRAEINYQTPQKQYLKLFADEIHQSNNSRYIRALALYGYISDKKSCPLNFAAKKLRFDTRALIIMLEESVRIDSDDLSLYSKALTIDMNKHTVTLDTQARVLFKNIHCSTRGALYNFKTRILSCPHPVVVEIE